MMHRLLVFLLASLLLPACHSGQQYSSEQLEVLLLNQGLDTAKFNVFIRSFKLEQELEVWVSTEASPQFTLLKTYPVCRASGDLGPKRKEGDRQVPEGFYHIDRLNPNSSYHLSLGLNYPNKSDRIRGNQEQPGSDIFIHGACVTVGCIPLTDPLIEEVYHLVETAKKRGQKQVMVHILPGRMQTDAFKKVMQGSPHSAFWQELLPIYQDFEKTKLLAPVAIDATGRYSLLPE
jgi:murein L,D-transpeptidase YafK